MSEAFKGYLISCLFVGTIGAFIWFFIIREKVAEHRIKGVINSEILKGNKVAVAMKIEGYSSLVDVENEVLITAALNGNESAIKALRIDVDRMNRKY